MFWVGALFVGAIVLGIVSGVARRLIAAGIELLKPVLDELRRTP